MYCEMHICVYTLPMHILIYIYSPVYPAISTSNDQCALTMTTCQCRDAAADVLCNTLLITLFGNQYDITVNVHEYVKTHLY